VSHVARPAAATIHRSETADSERQKQKKGEWERERKSQQQMSMSRQSEWLSPPEELGVTFSH